MVNGQAFEEATALARSNPGLSVGLHLMLVQGRCASPPASIPLLANADGLFRNAPVWAGMRFFFIPGIRAQIRREIVAQLDKFLATGLPLSHVDGHLTIHMHPVVVAVLIDVCQRYGIRSVRLPREPLGQALRYDRRHLLRKLFEAMSFNSLSRWATPRLERAGLRHPDRMFGLPRPPRGEDYAGGARRAPGGVSEIYCHPALIDDEARRWRPRTTRASKSRGADQPDVRDAITCAGIELISYREL